MKNNLKQIAILGTGPGNPDYLTRRAYEYLQAADVVLYDCLVDEIALTVIPDHIKVERVDKKYRKHNSVDIFDQEILKKIESYASQGLRVVRTKPGDSMNFNSGGMEADYLISKGFEVELVPGVPAHFAAANAFNLNLTEIHQSNGLISFIADELTQDEHLIPHLAYLLNQGVPVCLYGMRPELFPKIISLFRRFDVCESMPLALCCNISLKDEQLIPTTLNDASALVEILANEERLPGHFIAVLGKYILQSYVDFKSHSNIEKTCCH